MRPHLIHPVFCTVRPNGSAEADEFGDRSILVRDERGTAIRRVPIQLTYTKRGRSEEGLPGRDVSIVAFGAVLKRDLDRLGWTPAEYDLIQVPGGLDDLFIKDVQPAFPVKASIRLPDGGFAGYRLLLVDERPHIGAATQYE